ncbi:hypothetical protein AB0O01_11655 [Streptomyces sp. NPDC093252]|uniref:hypothetical protein n=1 Tax=Streptomyces sp. NPDC093252 TaxID=3154980 RepID=UPI0034286DC3
MTPFVTSARSHRTPAVLAALAAAALTACAAPAPTTPDAPLARPPATPAPSTPARAAQGGAGEGVAPGVPVAPETPVVPVGPATPVEPPEPPATEVPEVLEAPVTPSPSPTPSSPTAETPSPTPSTSQSAAPDGLTTLRIGSWSARVVRGGQDAVDACADAVQWTGPDLGTEDGYELSTAVIVGHDYCGGFDRFATLPLGTVVTVTTPRGTFRYRVYAHHRTPGRGTPAAGLYWGDLTLQSCVGPDTGFSYLTRI